MCEFGAGYLARAGVNPGPLSDRSSGGVWVVWGSELGSPSTMRTVRTDTVISLRRCSIRLEGRSAQACHRFGFRLWPLVLSRVARRRSPAPRAGLVEASHLACM